MDEAAEFVADIQDEVKLIERLSGKAVQRVSAESIAEISDITRMSDVEEPPVRNALVALKPPRRSKKKLT